MLLLDEALEELLLSSKYQFVLLCLGFLYHIYFNQTHQNQHCLIAFLVVFFFPFRVLFLIFLFLLPLTFLHMLVSILTLYLYYDYNL